MFQLYLNLAELESCLLFFAAGHLVSNTGQLTAHRASSGPVENLPATATNQLKEYLDEFLVKHEERTLHRKTSFKTNKLKKNIFQGKIFGKIVKHRHVIAKFLR